MELKFSLPLLPEALPHAPAALSVGLRGCWIPTSIVAYIKLTKVYINLTPSRTMLHKREIHMVRSCPLLGQVAVAPYRSDTRTELKKGGGVWVRPLAVL